VVAALFTVHCALHEHTDVAAAAQQQTKTVAAQRVAALCHAVLRQQTRQHRLLLQRKAVAAVAAAVRQLVPVSALLYLQYSSTVVACHLLLRHFRVTAAALHMRYTIVLNGC
jgi:hypothetical protein